MMLTVKEAAERLRVCPRTLLRLIDQGDIEAVIVSPSSSQQRKRLVVRDEEIQRYVEEVGVHDPFQ